jgi:general secretion pathway protein H
MNNKRGFTLIEILVALAIASLMIGIGLPSIKRVFRTNIKSAAARVSSVIRFAYDSAIIKHKLHRIVFDFEKKTYWVEISTKDNLIDSDIKEDQDLEVESISDKDKNEAKAKSKNFSAYPGEPGKPYKLPGGIIFEDVENLTTQKKITSEKAYLYFFPHGLTEALIIRLNGGASKTGYYSIKVNPINAKTKIEGRYVER